MSYCSVSQVRQILDSDVTDPEITDLITQTSALMDMKLSTSSINANVLAAICSTWVSVRCMLKDPESSALGEYRGDRTYALEKLNKMLAEMIKIADGGVSFTYGYESLPRSYVALG